MVWDLYFKWMCELVFPNIKERNNYRELLLSLHGMIFHFSIPLDENRMRDGIDLRYRFGYERGYSNDWFEQDEDPFRGSCSMLEMMVALALKGDDRIMYDYDTGSKADFIFKLMLTSLDLTGMTDYNFDITYVEHQIERLLNRQYDYNGKGGLFVVSEPRRDMRVVDIWYQMCWAIQELYD